MVITDTQIFAYIPSLNIIQVFEMNNGSQARVITGLPLVAFLAMGLTNTSHLVTVARDSSVNFFSTSNTRQFADIQQISALPSANFTTLTVDTAGLVYISASYGFTAISSDLSHFVFYETGSPSDKSCMSVATSQGMLFLGCQSGALWWFDLNQSRYLKSWTTGGIMGLFIPLSTPSILYMSRYNMPVVSFSIQGTTLTQLSKPFECAYISSHN
jgi:hypothetical protein